MKRNKPILYDGLIINRVEKYLEENVDKTYLDIGVMTKHLQDTYLEYSRRKVAPFRKLVEQAYRIVSHNYGMESQLSSTDGSDNSVLEMPELQGTAAGKNIISNMMQDLYKPKNNNKNNSNNVGPSKPVTTTGTIDISSDDSDDDSSDTTTTTSPKEPSFPQGLGRMMGANSTTASQSQALQGTVRQQKSNIPMQRALHDQTTSKAQSQTSLPKQQPRSQPLPRFQQLKAAAGTRSFDRADSANTQKTQKRKSVEPDKPNKRINSNSDNSGDNGRDPTQGGPIGGGKKQMLRAIAQSNLSRPKNKKYFPMCVPSENFADVGGMDETLKKLCETLLHIKTLDIYFVLGMPPPRGILIHGSPGCGKTLLARAIAGQLELPLLEISATELIAGVSGESEERIRDIFDYVSNSSPCVLFIDEIDVVSANRALASKEMERRVVSQLISCIDGLKTHPTGESVLVIGATTRPDVLDPGLRRAGRFDEEIAIGVPNRKDRRNILEILTRPLTIDAKCDLDKIAEITPGYVGADLAALISRAASNTVKRFCTAQLQAQSDRSANIPIVDLDEFDKSFGSEVDIVPTANILENDQETAIAVDVVNKESAEEVHEQVNIAEPLVANIAEPLVANIAEPLVPNIAEPLVPNIAEPSLASDNNTNIETINENEIEPMDVDAEHTAKADVTFAVTAADAENVPKQVEQADSTLASTSNNASEVPLQNEQPETSTSNSAPNTKAKKYKLNLSLMQWINWLKFPPEDNIQLQNYKITLDDFMEAIKVFQPSAKREGFTTVPDVTWDDVGSLREIREELKLAVLAPVKYPEKMARLGLSSPSGVLLCGPPGCGKTLIAKAIANEAGINFISVKGPELINMYVGESERAVRACFQRARNSTPCVIFFDEFDSLCPKRTQGNNNGSNTRVVNQLLTEMDGIEGRKGVYILAASNRPDIIDSAILRPGRLDTILYVGMPQHKDRVEILNATTKNRTSPVLADDVDFEEVANQTDGYTGADLAGLVRQSAMIALKESIDNNTDDVDVLINKTHFQKAIPQLRPSVSEAERKIYEELRLKYAAPRDANTNGVE